MSSSHVISADDPKALEKLQKKLASCERLQSLMKDMNVHYRKHGTCRGFSDISDSTAAKLESTMNSYDTQPYRSWELQSNNQEINRLRKRIEQITHDKEVGYEGWEFEGGNVVTNQELNRLQLFFDEKPSESNRAVLKAHGFKWAPSQDAWQRQLNANAIYSADRIDFLRPISGESVRQIQPATLQQTRGAR